MIWHAPKRSRGQMDRDYAAGDGWVKWRTLSLIVNEQPLNEVGWGKNTAAYSREFEVKDIAAAR